MIRTLTVFLSLAAAIVFSSSALGRCAPPADIAAVLDAWHAAAARADEDAYFSHFAPDGVFLGTDATERWTVAQFREYAHPHFAKGKAWTFHPRDRHISLAAGATTAWFDEALDTPHMGECRGSGVLVLLDGAWKIAQYNLSIPIPNDLCKDFVARIAAFAAASAPNGEGGASLKVITFNIRYDNPGDGPNRWSSRRDSVVEFLKAQDADVIGLQEVLRSQLDFLLAQLPQYAAIGVGRDDGKDRGEFSPILYRTARWRPAESGTFWFSDTPDTVASKGWGNNIVRICTWARFVPAKDGAGDRPFYHYNLHLDHESQPSRERSVVLLLEKIGTRPAADPVLVTGDFNAGEDNPAVKGMVNAVPLSTLSPRGDEVERARLAFVDTFRARRPDDTMVGTFNSFKGISQGPKIDFIFAGPGIRTAAAAIHRDRPNDRDLSDHYPVSATVLLPR